MNDLYFNLYATDMDYNRFIVEWRIRGWEKANYLVRDMMAFGIFKDITIEAHVDKDDSQPRQG